MKICIDAGHNYSGFDTGAIGNGLREQDVTFSIADKLRYLLKQKGIDVVMTRNNFTDNIGENAKDSINERAKIANRAKCDYFISIHCNAGGGTGTETLIYGTGGHAEPLAKCVNNKIVKHFDLKNRGIKVRTDLGVLRITNMPAILVETAFIDNKNDAVLLRDKTTEFAGMICDGVCEYLGIKGTPKNEISEYISVNDIVSELHQRGIVSDVDGMINEINLNMDGRLYWLARKALHYIRSKD